MGLSDAVHGIFVLASFLTYGLPISEAIKRKSPWWLTLFVTLGALTFSMHCEETSICAPLDPGTHRFLQSIDHFLGFVLFGSLVLVVLEIREEKTGRVAFTLLSLAALIRDIDAMALNAAGALILGLALLVYDAKRHPGKRRFTPAWWRRIALILLMAAAGGVLMAVLKRMWIYDGLWHAYYSVTCWLLLLAQRHKSQILQARHGKATDVSGPSAARSSSTWTSSDDRAHARIKYTQDDEDERITV